MTPLESHIRRLIRQGGPISVAEYMALALGHPDYGYYQTRDPLGCGGDFTTAPEISQMFGEMIGAWCLAVWGEHIAAPFNLVELGPGRGTLMRDLLRAAKIMPDFLNAASVHLVETSPALRDVQAAALADGNPVWHHNIEDVPDGPALFIANEFFDALPVRQFIATPDGLAERCVGLDATGEALCFGVDQTRHRAGQGIFPTGSIIEACPAATAITGDIARRIKAQGGAALVIDYGYAGPPGGDTLQAVKAHAYADPLQQPGEADLTAHVDFSALAQAARAEGIAAHGPVGQGVFLRQLGIDIRAQKLTALGATGVEAALHRLTAPDQMGTLFKVLALAQKGATLPGFAT